MSPKIRQAKGDQRREIRAARASRPDCEQQAHAAAMARWSADLAALCGEGPVASYVALPGEPDPKPMTDALAIRSGLVFPRVAVGKTRQLEWVRGDAGFARRDQPPRVLEPTGPALTGELGDLVTAVLVPCLALHSSGRRLGQGGGFYDTTLAGIPAGVPLIGVVFANEVRDDVVFEEHDAQLTHVICETGLAAFPTGHHD